MRLYIFWMPLLYKQILVSHDERCRQKHLYTDQDTFKSAIMLIFHTGFLLSRRRRPHRISCSYTVTLCRLVEKLGNSETQTGKPKGWFYLTSEQRMILLRIFFTVKIHIFLHIIRDGGRNVKYKRLF